MQDIKVYSTFTDVLAWFDNMDNPIPTWYLENFYVQYIDNVPYI